MFAVYKLLLSSEIQNLTSANYKLHSNLVSL